MADKLENHSAAAPDAADEINRFAESYASFNRIINNLQRQYIELKEEFSAQNERLVETNRKLVEMTAANLAATDFLNNLLTSISAGVIAVDQAGRITHFNPAAAVMIGIPVKEARGKFYRDVIAPGEPVDANALRAAETGREMKSVEKCVELPDGTRLHLSVSTSIMLDDDGKPSGAVEVFHDLTRVKKMESEIARLNTLAALGEMAATIAHQVRNPLAGIGGFAALLKRDMDDDDPRQKSVSHIVRGVDNLDQTVTALLDYTRSDEIKKDLVILEQFLDRIIKQYRHQHGEMVSEMSIRVLPPKGPPTDTVLLSMDQQLCQQLFFNLFSNAAEACAGAGEVAISFRKLPRQTATRRYGDNLLIGLDETIVEIKVTDNGPGIGAEALESVFSPFFTTKQGGSGLGLAVGWKVIKAHGGDIFAENIPDGGARFTILFPTRIDTASKQEARGNV